mgnify:CR=1 FL=1|jgi:hypothetical protein
MAALMRRAILPLLLLALVACAWVAPFDAPAGEKVDAGLKRALVSFATARALNGAISVAQGTELSLQPAGVGATFAPGQLLDPVNDLVERFSDLMLGASVLFGAQKVLLGVGSYWPISTVLSLVALAWAALWWRRRRIDPWLSRLLVLFLMLRFAVPAVTLASDRVWQQFLDQDYRVSQQAIDATSSAAASTEATAVQAAPAPHGVLEQLRRWLARTTDVRARFDELEQMLERATEHLIRLMVVFVLQTLVVPVVLLWAMWSWTRSLFESP